MPETISAGVPGRDPTNGSAGVPGRDPKAEASPGVLIHDPSESAVPGRLPSESAVPGRLSSIASIACCVLGETPPRGVPPRGVVPGVTFPAALGVSVDGGKGERSIWENDCLREGDVSVRLPWASFTRSPKDLVVVLFLLFAGDLALPNLGDVPPAPRGDAPPGVLGGGGIKGSCAGG
jgi:hypothetical protein